jgi:uncharacterized membrane protein
MTAASHSRAVRASDAAALAIIGAMLAAAVLLYDAVPTEMVVHYTPPGGVYYGPETLPRAVGLFVVPVVAVVTFALARWIATRRDVREALAEARVYYHAGLVALVAALAAIQALLLWLNLP